MNNWIEISPSRLAANFAAVQTAAGADTTVVAVIKANAYGHGAETCAPILVRAGATWLGVTCASEGARVRNVLLATGLTAEIMIMSGFLPQDAASIHEHHLTPVVWTLDQVASLALYPGTRVHIEVDTGMGRQGVRPGPPLDRLLTAIAAAGLIPDGLFTHFCSSEVADAPITLLQQQRFQNAVEQLRRTGLTLTWLHAANSSAVDNPAADPAADPAWLPRLASSVGAAPMVRTGLALYGYTLPIEGGSHPRLHDAVRPVLTWKARILAVHHLAAGDTVGYNAIFTAPAPMQVAVLPVGYADGLRRELSSSNTRPGGWATIHGHRAPILGRISMNLTVVDITRIANVTAGDEAILLGDLFTADDHAILAQTIPYEILCGIHPCS